MRNRSEICIILWGIYVIAIRHRLGNVASQWRIKDAWVREKEKKKRYRAEEKLVYIKCVEISIRNFFFSEDIKY